MEDILQFSLTLGCGTYQWKVEMIYKSSKRHKKVSKFKNEIIILLNFLLLRPSCTITTCQGLGTILTIFYSLVN